MNAAKIFISHTTADDAIVAEVRKALEGQGLPVWVDSRELSAGDELKKGVFERIERARHFMVVLSPAVINSEWVDKEIKHALKVQKDRSDGYKVIPILLDGVQPPALSRWFGEYEPLAVHIGSGHDAVDKALPELLAAVGKRAPSDSKPATENKPGTIDEPHTDGTLAPSANLTLELNDLTLRTAGGKRRAKATATLIYTPPTRDASKVKSTPYKLTAPLGAIEEGELRWYLERYAQWPVGVFQDRAEKVVKMLPDWGDDLFEAALKPDAASEAYEAWKRVGDDTTRRFTIEVDQALPEDASKTKKKKRPLTKKQQAAQEAATQLLALPWELLHDSDGYLLQGARGIRVTRRLPNRKSKKPVVTEAPLRVLLVSPRPEDDRATYIDHRVSARPLVDALTPLGKNVELTLLDPPTFPALGEELNKAHKAKKPYHVVHFDGHGVYDPKLGLGALCFEDPADIDKLEERRCEIIDAEDLAGMIRDHRIPLFFLEACQSAMTKDDPTASVAAKLLQQGVASVVAMSHSVLVETARRFVTEFYDRLMTGATIGEAMLAGRQALHADTRRGKVFGGGELHLHDWFVPVLFQEEHDPRMIHGLTSKDVAELRRKEAELSLGDLPSRPEHTFVGRSRELLTAERTLVSSPYVVFQGTGGEGKTTLAAELARWLVETQRFDRAAFVCLEKRPDPRNVLYALGEQLVTGFVAAAAKDEKDARLKVERALRDHRTVMVLDNMESVLPPVGDASAQSVYEPEVLEELLTLVGDLQKCGDTKLIFTTRERMPSPFDGHHIVTGRLTETEAIELVGGVLKHNGVSPAASDAGKDEDEIKALVTAVNCHARALVLIAGEVGSAGVAHTTRNLHGLMSRLDERYPDDRERSLYASVELSLQRLPQETRERIRQLGVFHGGGQVGVIAMVLGLDVEKDEVIGLAGQLIGVGLAEDMGGGYLRLDPALGPYLLGQLSDDERQRVRKTWAEAMAGLTHFLYRQSPKGPQLARDLTLLDLANLVGGLEHLGTSAPAETVVHVATSLEALLADLARPKALGRVVAVRTKAHADLGEWSHARYLAERAAVERLLEKGNLPGAVAAARALLQKAQSTGEDAYAEAAYDIAMIYATLGRALRMSGDPETALGVLEKARTGFHTLGQAGNKSAARMASTAIADSGWCLLDLGRLDEAGEAYEESVERAEKRGDPRDVAVGKGQLGTVRMLQRRFDEALAAHVDAREIFEQLGEPNNVATAWHLIAMVHKHVGQHDAAEQAHLKSLAISVQTHNRPGEAGSLGELGSLYCALGRYEESVRFYRQAADICVELENLAKEGGVRGNLANTLIKLERYDEARAELVRAVECNEPFGHAAVPWTTWNILCDLERAVDDADAAAVARRKAVDTYLAYRRAGGENQNPGAKYCAATARAIAEGKTDKTRAELAQLLQDPDLPAWAKVLIPGLQAILDGSRDPTLPDNPDLDYDDAAEVRLLLETLAGGA